MNQTLIVSAQEKGQRLDKFLTEKIVISRSQIQKMIKSGAVTVNDKPVTVHHFLKENDLVNIKDGGAEKKSAAQPKLPTLDILYQDSDILVINKPAGLIVHPAPGIKERTLVHALLAQYPDIKTVGDEPATRPGIVHRLDKEVSGCLIVAKTQKAFANLKEQFQEHKIKKEYLALVYDRVSKDTDEIKFPIERGGSGKMTSKPVGGAGREAVTRFDVAKRFPQYTLLKVETLTGRTHQIRAHLKAYGHSIVADKLYVTRHQKIKEDLPQIFLHASKIGFDDLAGEWRQVEAPLPLALEHFLNQLP